MNTTTKAAIALTLLASTAAHAQTAVQWKVADGGNGHWYKHVPDLQSFTWHQQRAVSHGASVVCIADFAENQFVWNLVHDIDPGPFDRTVWIGLIQDPIGGEPDQGWHWIDGAASTYRNWLPSEPNNYPPYEEDNCRMIVSMEPSPYQGTWQDYAESSQFSSVIEWSADCNADGIVDYGQCHDGTLPDYNGNNIPDCCEQGVQGTVGNYPVQWRVEDGGNGHWYQLKRRSSVVSWASASEESVSLGGQLASILSEAEDVFVFSVADHPGAWQGYLGPWLGGWQVPGTGEPLGIWRWSSGEPWGYVGPDSTFPNNGGPPGTDESRLHYIDFVRKWNDLPENGAPENGGGVRAFVIEWSADCNNDGAVDYGQILQGQLADANTDGIPDTCQCGTIPSLPACCPGDLDHDRTVGGADIGLLLSNWGPCGSACLYDLNNDSKVNGGDLGLLLAGWGPCSN